jgi:glutamate-5-semialdehyde dehydrogenase
MLDMVAKAGDVAAVMGQIGRNAKAAARELATASTEAKNKALQAMADAILAARDKILAANAADLKGVEGKDLLPSFIDRLTLTEKSIAGIAQALREIAEFKDPVGEVIAAWDRPNGLKIERVRTPLGVIGVIY